MNSQQTIRASVLVGILMLVSVLGLTSCSSSDQSHASNTSASSSAFAKDTASSDTPVETLKTLTAEISTVEQQNQQLVAQNKALNDKDKIELAQFKQDVLAQVNQQLEQTKTQTQAQALAAKSSEETTATTAAITGQGNGNPTVGNVENGFTWIADMQNGETVVSGNSKNGRGTTQQLASVLNPSSSTAQESNHAEPSDVLKTNHTPKVPPMPYYTIPVNATLTGAIAMQPIIGRIPIEGKVPDPYTFKAIIGPRNLAANGIDIPSNIQGIVVAGIAEGDMLGKCARGEITALTFVFNDGRISTTQAKDATQPLGTIAGANGNPCIRGTFYSDAALFLGTEAGLAGLQGYGNALSQAEVSNVVTPTSGATISSLVGSANRYALGQGFSASAQAAQHWWDQRVQSSFDFVYVPNVDPKTHKKLLLNINITQEIPIDYDPQARKVFYAHPTTSSMQQLD